METAFHWHPEDFAGHGPRGFRRENHKFDYLRIAEMRTITCSVRLNNF